MRIIFFINGLVVEQTHRCGRKTLLPPKTPDFLTEAEIDLLHKGCRNPEQRYLIAVLFDSGARAEEFHNIRMEDVFSAEGRESFFRLALKEEYSKTKPPGAPLRCIGNAPTKPFRITCNSAIARTHEVRSILFFVSVTGSV
jgi:integrase